MERNDLMGHGLTMTACNSPRPQFVLQKADISSIVQISRIMRQARSGPGRARNEATHRCRQCSSPAALPL